MQAENHAHQVSVLTQYPRAIVHLRQQFKEDRFGAVLGAGTSIDLKVPSWKELVEKLAADSEVEGADLLSGKANRASLPYKTEMLLQRFSERQKAKIDSRLSHRERENTISSRWLALCGKYLYSSRPSDPSSLEAAIKRHPYFGALVEVVQESHLTINFNFDDYLETALGQKKRQQDKQNKGYECITNPWSQIKRRNSVVYHPHGVVPFGLMELPHDRFVFSEESYAKQYIRLGDVDTTFLLAHFARNTCLLIGCSLEDALRTALIRSAHVNPGNYHYYVQHLQEGDSVADPEREAIADTNFRVYNLITLFLNSLQIRALLELVNYKAIADGEFTDLATRCKVRIHYNYYMTGALGVGKSTTALLLRSLYVLDEWLEARPVILGKPPDQLTDAEREEADGWILQQFEIKNNTLRQLSREAGVVAIVDRPPMDPLVFTPQKGKAGKAKALLDRLCPEQSWKVVEGAIILLLGDPRELSARVRATGRENYSEDRLKTMQDDLRAVYVGDGVIPIETYGLSSAEVTRRVAEWIHRKPYVPFDLHRALLTQSEAPA